MPNPRDYQLWMCTNCGKIARCRTASMIGRRYPRCSHCKRRCGFSLVVFPLYNEMESGQSAAGRKEHNA